MNALWLSLILVVPFGSSSAPVYRYVSDGILERAGTFVYKPSSEGYAILYCIAQPPRTTLSCVVRTPLDALVIIEATATEQQT